MCSSCSTNQGESQRVTPKGGDPQSAPSANPGIEQAAVKIQCAFRVKNAKKEVKKKKLTKKLTKTQRRQVAAAKKQKKLDDEEIQEIMAQLEKESIERRQGEKDYIASLHK